MSRSMHSVHYDAIHDEIFIPVPTPQTILTFRGGANGEEAPIRVIQGPLTQLIKPDQMEIDPTNNEIFVPQPYNETKVLVFQRDAVGNVAPIRVLRPTSGMRFGNTVAVDPVNNLLVVAGSVGGQDRMLIYNRTDEGTVAPKAVIGGPKSHYNGPSGPFAVYAPKGWLVMTTHWNSEGDDSTEAGMAANDHYVGVWSEQDSGDVPPRWILGGPNGVFRQTRGIALDPKSKSLFVADKWLNAVLTFSFPEIY